VRKPEKRLVVYQGIAIPAGTLLQLRRGRRNTGRAGGCWLCDATM